MSLFPPVWSKDTPWGLSREATQVLWAVADAASTGVPVYRDGLVKYYGRAWTELHGLFLTLANNGQTVEITPLGVAAATSGRSAKVDERKAARREFLRLCRERKPGSSDDLLTEGHALEQERLRLEEGLRDVMREFAPMLAAGMASIEGTAG